MSLTVSSKLKAPGVYILSPVGSLDTNTYQMLENNVSAILEESPGTLVFDMEKLDYISSAGVRVVLKAKKLMKEHEGNVMMLNLQPQIKKVFEIINALPTQQIFSSVQELDAYLDKMQKDPG